MDIKKWAFIKVVLLFVTLSSAAQQGIGGVKIGRKIPEVILKQFVNPVKESVKLSELYKGKLLIIDFWATWCVPCIQEMHFLDSLKAKYPDKFNVLMISQESEGIVTNFINRKPPNFGRNLDIVYGDRQLNSLFRHKSIPHNVWVDSTGTVRAITGSDEVTVENILNFGKNTMSLKAEELNFDETKEFHLNDSSFVYRSIITKAINTGNAGIFQNRKDDQVSRFFLWNGAAVMLYYMAYSTHQKYPSGAWRPSLIEVHTKDSLRLFSPTKERAFLLKNSRYTTHKDWAKDNLYCYALTLPDFVPDSVFRDYMFADLQRQFGITANIENRIIPVNVVTCSKTIDGIKSTSTGKTSVGWGSGYKLNIRNARVDDVLKWLFSAYGPNVLPDPYLNQIPKDRDIYFDADLKFSKEQFENGIPLQIIYDQLLALGIKIENKSLPYPILVLRDMKI